MNTQPARQDITLSNGTVVRHRREPNGSQFAWVVERCEQPGAITWKGESMLDAEWDEYCALIVTLAGR